MTTIWVFDLLLCLLALDGGRFAAINRVMRRTVGAPVLPRPRRVDLDFARNQFGQEHVPRPAEGGVSGVKIQ